MLLHHTGKEGQQRGTSSREDNIDISIILKRPFSYTAEDGARFVVHFTKWRVATRNLTALADIEFRLREDPGGKVVWVHNDVRIENKRAILKASDEGMKNRRLSTFWNSARDMSPRSWRPPRRTGC